MNRTLGDAGQRLLPLEHAPRPAGKGGAGAQLRRWLGLPLPIDAGVVFAMSLATGAAVYFTLDNEPSAAWVGMVVAAGLAAWLCLRAIWIVPALATIGLALMGLGGGVGLAKLRTVLVTGAAIAEESEPVLVEGWIVAIDRGAAGPRLLIDVHAISGWPAEQTPVRVRMTHMTGLEVAPGRFVRCYGVLRPPPAPSMAGEYDFRRDAWFRGLGAVGYVLGRCRGGALGPPDSLLGAATTRLASWRRQLASHVSEAAGPKAGGLAAALMTGDRSFLAPEDADALRGAGLAHLLAISGLHMGIVGGLVYLIVRRGLALIEPLAVRVAVQKPAAVAALLASAAYLVISGASVSTQRAFIMAAIFFGAILIDRAALSLRSFALAMIAVVAIHPESVMTPGFQMSFAATGALIASYEAWSQRRRATLSGRGTGFGFAVKSLVLTSVVGGASTTPFALYHFGRLATLGLAANLAAMPIISFVTAPLAAVALIAAPFGLADPALRAFGWSLEWVLAIARFFDHDEAISSRGLPPLDAWSLIWMTIALFGLVAARGWFRAFLAALFAVLGLAAWWNAPRPLVHWSPSGEVFLLTEGGYVGADFTEGDGLGPMQFAQVPTSLNCRGGCQSETLGHTAFLHAAAMPIDSCAALGDAIHLFAQDGPVHCPNTLSWDQVQRLGGQTLLIDRAGDIRIEREAVCSPRPWSPCPAPRRGD